MKKYLLPILILLAACLALTACDIEDLLDEIYADTETESETEIHDEQPWLPPETAETRPAESETVTDDPYIMPISPDELTGIAGAVFNMTQSYVTENALFLRAEHLPVDQLSSTLPAVLRISDRTAWRSFYTDQVSDGCVPDASLLAFMDELTEEFFSTRSLLVVVTEGRSGSIRYRLDGVHDTRERLTLELVAEVPAAITMDIVHWCVVIPVDKAMADLPVELVLRDETMDENGEVTVRPPAQVEPRRLHFWGYGDGSYARDGILYGRIDAPQGTGTASAQLVSTREEWQSLYLGDAAAEPHMDADFLTGLEALDASFFAERSLLILYREEGSGSNRHRVDGVAVKDGILTVAVTTLYPEEGTCDMAYWAILIPVDKEVVGLPIQVETATERME